MEASDWLILLLGVGGAGGKCGDWFFVIVAGDEGQAEASYWLVILAGSGRKRGDWLI